MYIFPALIRGPGKVRRLAEGSGTKVGDQVSVSVSYGRQEGETLLLSHV